MPRVERPATAEDCAALLRACAADGQTVRVRGGGTKDHLGRLYLTAVTLETARLAGIVDHVPEDLTVTVRAGTTLRAVRDALAAHGQFLPIDAPHVGRGATIGGVIAADSNGFGRYRYGSVRDLLLGVRAALPDGTIARSGGRVVKNVAGYDLDKLFIGSLGTLGVVVEATFKILPVPPVARAATATFATPGGAFGAADTLVRTSLRPTAVVVARTDESGWRLVIAAAGEAAPVERALAELTRVAATRDATATAAGDVEAELGPLRELVDAAETGAVVRAALPLSAQTAFAETALHLDRSARVVADAASGIVLVHLRDDAGLPAAADALLANARVLGGSARIERAAVPGLDPFGGPEPAGAFLMRRLKDAFDPSGILEPARSAVG
ncbi:MAG TPA: FAD-binding oxidoreductase [Candidatus Limnocylindria bacterium]|nr:FAD-binding oxidoreductase [Candidatus Limnocylindria bacterium]